MTWFLEVKNLLIQSLMLPMRQPQLFRNATPIRNILLYGPPGTGKTMLAKCVASQMNLPFLSVSCSSLLTPYFGESEAKVSKLFTRAQNLSDQNQPCVIFFDEIDAVTRKRSETEDEVTRRVKSELLRSIDGISNSRYLFGSFRVAFYEKVSVFWHDTLLWWQCLLSVPLIFLSFLGSLKRKSEFHD